jgi:hypothetical protein
MRYDDGDFFPYTLFEICRVGTKAKHQINDVRHFKDEKKFVKAVRGAKIKIDQNYGRRKIKKLLQEIERIEYMYQLN